MSQSLGTISVLITEYHGEEFAFTVNEVPNSSGGHLREFEGTFSFRDSLMDTEKELPFELRSTYIYRDDDSTRASAILENIALATVEGNYELVYPTDYPTECDNSYACRQGECVHLAPGNEV